MKYIITLSLIFSMTLFTTISKAQMRLMGKAHRTYVSAGNILEDSVRYFHSGTKGASPGKYKIPEFELMEDSMHVFTKDGTGVKFSGKRISFYKTNNDFDYSIYYTWSDSANNWRNSLRTRIIYANNKPDTVYYESWSTFGSGSWRANTRIFYTWNGNNIATRTRQTRGFGQNPQWTNRENNIHTWSGNNETDFVSQRWSSGNWVDSGKRTTTYTSGKVTDVSTFKYSSGNWVDDSKSTYAYDGNSRLLTIKRDIYTGVWEPNRIDTFIYIPSNTNYPDTTVSILYSFGGFVNEGKFAYQYLPDGRPTEQISMSWDGNSQWIQTNNQDSINHWYYGWMVSVEDVNANNDKISVYPSPANNTIHITLDGVVQDKHVQFAILDMQGRLVKNWSEYSKAQTTMSVSELPSGNYILFVEDGTFKGVRKFTVSR